MEWWFPLTDVFRGIDIGVQCWPWQWKLLKTCKIVEETVWGMLDVSVMVYESFCDQAPAAAMLEVWRSQNQSGGSAAAISFAVALLCYGCVSVGGAWYLSRMSQGGVALHHFDVGWEICEPLEREMSGNNPGECVRILQSTSILPDFWGVVPWCGKLLFVGFHRGIDFEKTAAMLLLWNGWIHFPREIQSRPNEKMMQGRTCST